MVLHVNGILTPVIVDEFLPVRGNYSVFGKTNRSTEIWAQILEKAWAKLFGSYARIERGMP